MTLPSHSESVWVVWGIEKIDGDWPDEIELVNGCVYRDEATAEHVLDISLPRFDDGHIQELPVLPAQRPATVWRSGFDAGYDAGYSIGLHEMKRLREENARLTAQAGQAGGRRDVA